MKEKDLSCFGLVFTACSVFGRLRSILVAVEISIQFLSSRLFWQLLRSLNYNTLPFVKDVLVAVRSLCMLFISSRMYWQLLRSLNIRFLSSRMFWQLLRSLNIRFLSSRMFLVAVEITYYTIPFVNDVLVVVRSLNIQFLSSRMFWQLLRSLTTRFLSSRLFGSCQITQYTVPFVKVVRSLNIRFLSSRLFLQLLRPLNTCRVSLVKAVLVYVEITQYLQGFSRQSCFGLC